MGTEMDVSQISVLMTKNPKYLKSIRLSIFMPFSRKFLLKISIFSFQKFIKSIHMNFYFYRDCHPMAASSSHENDPHLLDSVENVGNEIVFPQ